MDAALKGHQGLTSMNSLMAGQVAFVAEGRLAAVTLVWLVAVNLDHVVFEGIFLHELGVTPIAEISVAFCRQETRECEFISQLWLHLLQYCQIICYSIAFCCLWSPLTRAGG